MTRHEYGHAYEQGYKLTVRFLLSKGVPRDAAEESAQAAWARGWERIHQLRERDFLRTWVNTIALNLHRRSVRADNRKQALSDCPGGNEVNVAAIDLARLLRFCSDSERLLLRQQLHGLSTCEMASAVGTTETAVRIRASFGDTPCASKA